MVEPIGLTIGLIGSCDVIARVTLKLSQYVSEVKSAPKEIERISTELETLEAVTSALQGFLRSARVKRLNFAESTPIAVFVDKCKQYIIELERDFVKRRSKSLLL
jgi:hypothetical protein